jgi:hypothetical protein
MMKLMLVVGAAGWLAGCAVGPPESQAQQADDAACTAQADATYTSDSPDLLARTSQNGLIYGATPTHVFDAEQMGAQHDRDSAITKCEQTGNNSGAPTVNGVPVVPPKIVGTP